jgi:hypothetical protein
MPIIGKDRAALYMPMIAALKICEKTGLYTVSPHPSCDQLYASDHELAQILPFWSRHPFIKGWVKQAEQDSKMFKNITLDYFWTGWTLSLAVNLSSSQNMVTGAAS